MSPARALAAILLLCLPIAACESSPSAPVCAGPVRVNPAFITAPVKIFAPSPQYTEIARKARIEGLVIVEGIVDCDGSYHSLRVLEGLPLGLDQAALDALSRWRFRPATSRGRPIRVWWTVTVNFALQ